jgi:hypothetical protein
MALLLADGRFLFAPLLIFRSLLPGPPASARMRLSVFLFKLSADHPITTKQRNIIYRCMFRSSNIGISFSYELKQFFHCRTLGICFLFSFDFDFELIVVIIRAALIIVCNAKCMVLDSGNCNAACMLISIFGSTFRDDQHCNNNKHDGY